LDHLPRPCLLSIATEAPLLPVDCSSFAITAA
jgi:hypothetical protein